MSSAISQARLALVSVLALLVVTLSGCNNQDSTDQQSSIDKKSTSIEQVERETRDFLQTIADYSVDKKDAAIEDANQALDRLDQRIDELQSKLDDNLDSMTANARQQARERMQSLRQQRKQLAEWYEKMQSSTADSWQHIKQGFTEAYTTLQRASEKAEEEFVEK